MSDENSSNAEPELISDYWLQFIQDYMVRENKRMERVSDMFLRTL